MSSLPKISIVTPNRNQGRFIEATIKSVLDQEYPNLEYIVIDGNSSDESLQIIRGYESRLAYWVSEPDSGHYDAVQKGLARSTGEIMTYLNSDDVLAEKSLFTVAQLFSDYPQIEWLGGIPNHIDESGRRVWVGPLKRWNRYRYLDFDFEYIQQEGVFWRRSLWDRTGAKMSTAYKLAGDLELWSRFFEHADFYAIPGILGSFRLRSQNQRSLEGMDQYTAEARKILAGMPRRVDEMKMLAKTHSPSFRLLRKKPLRVLFSLMGYESIENEVFRFAPLLEFDRDRQRYELRRGTEVERTT